MKFLCWLATNPVMFCIGGFFQRYLNIFWPIEPDPKYEGIRPLDAWVYNGLFGWYIFFCLIPLALLFFISPKVVSVVEICVMLFTGAFFQWLQQKILDRALLGSTKEEEFS